MIFIVEFASITDKTVVEKNDDVFVTPEQLHALRRWERKNLPHYGKEAGYLLFLELAREGGGTAEMLKEFYLSMPYAESTMRLLLRNLESDGWIEMPRDQDDKRVRKFVLTEKFEHKRDEWLAVVSAILGSANTSIPQRLPTLGARRPTTKGGAQ